jgi:hypothetical protein
MRVEHRETETLVQEGHPNPDRSFLVENSRKLRYSSKIGNCELIHVTLIHGMFRNLYSPRHDGRTGLSDGYHRIKMTFKTHG